MELILFDLPSTQNNRCESGSYVMAWTLPMLPNGSLLAVGSSLVEAGRWLSKQLLISPDGVFKAGFLTERWNTSNLVARSRNEWVP